MRPDHDRLRFEADVDLGSRPEIELAENGPIDHEGGRVPETIRVCSRLNACRRRGRVTRGVPPSSGTNTLVVKGHALERDKHNCIPDAAA
jgi:hypothetical protein